MEVITSPFVVAYNLLSVAIGLTALAFIAMILFLDRRPAIEPIILPPPDKKY